MANNEYINKVEYGDQTLMDITDTTAENSDVIEGQVFYARNGARSVGTLGDATQSTHGLMSATDKTKLDEIDLQKKADGILNEASGSIAYIPDGMENYILKDYEITLNPMQLVEGEISPTNIGTISGIDQIEIYQHKKNIFYINFEIIDINTGNDSSLKRTLEQGNVYIGVTKDNEWYGRSNNRFIDSLLDNAISFSSDNINYGMGVCCLVRSSTIYTLSYRAEDNNHIGVSIAEYKKDGTFIQGTQLQNSNLTFTTSKYTNFILVIFHPTADTINSYLWAADIQLEYGNQATLFTEGGPTITYSKAFGPDIGTIYYGTIESENNQLTKNDLNINTSLNTFTVVSTNTNTIHYRKTDFFSTFQLSSNFTGVCNVATFASGDADTIHFNVGESSLTKQLDIWLPKDTPSDINIQVISDTQFIFSSFEPPDNITLYKGENYFYTNGTNIHINYAADTKSYIDHNIDQAINYPAVEVIRL